MQRFRTFIGAGLGGLLLLAILVACGSSTQATPRPLVTATESPTAAPTVTASTPGFPGLSGSPIIARPSGSPIIARPTGTLTLPFPSGPPAVTPGANAVAPTSDGNCPDSHPIKGAQLGPVKTYLLKESTGYGSARASECFANEADAEAAGYRKAQR